MNQRLADLRPKLATLEDARRVFREYALVVKRLAYLAARAEKQIAEIKSRLADNTAGDTQTSNALASDLCAFITAYPALFQSPRTVKTEFGEFGFRTATEVDITDEQALMQALMERCYEDCFEVATRPVKAGIRKRLAAGESIPGARLRTGDTVVCKVAAALIEEARKDAED